MAAAITEVGAMPFSTSYADRDRPPGRGRGHIPTQPTPLIRSLSKVFLAERGGAVVRFRMNDPDLPPAPNHRFSRITSSAVSEYALCSVCSAISSQTLATRSKWARRTGVAVCADRKHSAACLRYPVALNIDRLSHAENESGAILVGKMVVS